MRVIAGKYKGRRLSSLKNLKVRPTSDRVKESVFSIIRKNVTDANFLDLCAGSGSIGIEALSQGAKQVTFLDEDTQSIRLIEQNLEKCGLNRQNPQILMLQSEASKGISILSKQGKTYALIYFDPPYNAGIYKHCITQISDERILETKGLLLIEHHHNTQLPLDIGTLRCDRQNRYGATKISFYRHKGFEK